MPPPLPAPRGRPRHGLRSRQRRHTVALALCLLPPLLSAGCAFDQADLTDKRSCRDDGDCLAGWRCLDERCYRATGGAWDQGRPQADLGEPWRHDQGPRRDVAVPTPDAQRPPADAHLPPADAGRPDGGGAGSDAARPHDQGPRPPDLTPPDTGPPPCAEGPCGAQEVCNIHGQCVPAHGFVDYCRSCVDDGDCGGPKGVCFGSRYRDEFGFQVAGPDLCHSSCVGPADCPAGMGCEDYQRDERAVGVCTPRVTSCESWQAFGQDCSVLDDQCPYPGFCAEVEPGDMQWDFGCSYLCAVDEDCPQGARCDHPLGGEIGTCVYE